MREHEQIGPFVLIGFLGRGARSQVWRARDVDGAEVALKLVPRQDAAACARLRHEALMADTLCPAGQQRHPHLAACLGHGSSGQEDWLATELLAPAPAHLTLASFRQLLLALAHVHGRGVVHCDIKPANLLMAPGGVLKLSDFGIARLRGAGAGPAHGSPCYMAPEQLRGQALDARADLFAAGVLLYQIVAGRRPFEGSAFEVMQQILGGRAAPDLCSAVHDGPGAAYAAVLNKVLAHEPAQRYASAQAFLYAVDTVCQRHSSQLS